MTATALDLETLRSRFMQSARNWSRGLERDGRERDGLDRESLEKNSESLDWADLADALPDGTFPHGVVELSSPYALGGTTRIAFSAVRTAQKKSADACCAWLDPFCTLYGPGAKWAGVDLARLFVVRPPESELGRIAVKVVRSGAFDVVVVDIDPVGTTVITGKHKNEKAMHVVVRKLALAAEETGCTVILITDSRRPRALPWPVAMRLELERRPGKLGVRVAKERYGRIGNQTWMPFCSEHARCEDR